jgi:homogentisate 1,2-dioxygenase
MDPQHKQDCQAEGASVATAQVSSGGKFDDDRSPQQQRTLPPPLRYLHGFGNTFESEALEGALPVGRNNPRIVPYNLYTEQLSGTAFTAPRAENRRTWLYRIQPAVVCDLVGDDDGAEEGPAGSPSDEELWFGQCDPAACRPCTDPCRWGPLPAAGAGNADGPRPPVLVDFCSGMRLMCTSADHSINIYAYACNASMTSQHLNNTDGGFLIVPQARHLRLMTELGRISLGPGEVCVVPRGIIFQVKLEPENGGGGSDGGVARGYVLEVTKGHFALPELGPIVRM